MKTNPLTLISDLYKGVDGFELSQKAIQNHPYYHISMDYDEMTTESFCSVLDGIRSYGHHTFYDLGSGVGKKVFLAALYGKYSKSIGIELLEGMYQISHTILTRYNNLTSHVLKRIPFINFIHNDFRQIDISDGDVFFLSLDRFGMRLEFQSDLGKKLEQAKKNSIVITTGIPFKSPYYSLLSSRPCKFKDHESNVFISIKI